jgi:hypothetical protein
VVGFAGVGLLCSMITHSKPLDWGMDGLENLDQGAD